jgi:hypothetical protein
MTAKAGSLTDDQRCEIALRSFGQDGCIFEQLQEAMGCSISVAYRGLAKLRNSGAAMQASDVVQSTSFRNRQRYWHRDHAPKGAASRGDASAKPKAHHFVDSCAPNEDSPNGWPAHFWAQAVSGHVPAFKATRTAAEIAATNRANAGFDRHPI